MQECFNNTKWKLLYTFSWTHIEIFKLELKLEYALHNSQFSLKTWLQLV